MKTSAELTSGPIGRTLAKLTVYMVFGFFATIAFNLVDTWFVAKMGTHELAAMGFTFPVVMVIGAIAIGLGAGASALVSRALGEGNHKKAQRLTTDALMLALVIVLGFIVVGLLTIGPIFRAMGASPEILPLIREYMIVWYPGMLFLVVPMVGNNAIRATGDMKSPSIIMMTSVLINIVLDPLLIFGIGPFPRWGLAGAAAATVVARAVTLVLSLYILQVRKRMLTASFPGLETLVKSWKSLMFIGIPAAGTTLIRPLGIGVLTALVAGYGPAAVAAYGVSTRVDAFAFIILMALSTVLSPFVGQNLGAGRMDRVRGGIIRAHLFSLGWGGFVAVIFFVLASPIATLFSTNPKVVSVVVLYLRLIPIGYGLLGIFGLSNAALNVLNRPWDAMSLACIQMFGFFVPGAWLGSRWFGLPGLFGAGAIASILGGILGAAWLSRVLRKYDRRPV